MAVNDVKAYAEEGVHGAQIKLQDSKTGPADIYIARRRDRSQCPVAALEQWQRAAAINSGPLFPRFRGERMVQGARAGALHPGAVSSLVKTLAKRARLRGEFYSAHSLRAGFTTEALRQRLPEALVRAQTRHSSSASLGRYFQERAAPRSRRLRRAGRGGVADHGRAAQLLDAAAGAQRMRERQRRLARPAQRVAS